jgi:hypothetical protein
MSLDYSTRLSARLGSGILARLARVPRLKRRLPRISWPKIRMQTVRQSCQGVSVTDIALSFEGWEPPAGNSNPRPKFEGTLYLVWKRKD